MFNKNAADMILKRFLFKGPGLRSNARKGMLHINYPNTRICFPVVWLYAHKDACISNSRELRISFVKSGFDHPPPTHNTHRQNPSHMLHLTAYLPMAKIILHFISLHISPSHRSTTVCLFNTLPITLYYSSCFEHGVLTHPALQTLHRFIDTV